MLFNIWKKFLVKFKKIISLNEFNMWIFPLKVFFNRKKIFLYAPNKFIFNYVYKKYIKLINYFIFKEYNNNFTLYFNYEKVFFIKNYYFLNKDIKMNNCILLNNYRFDNFIFSDSNYIAYKESLNICFLKKEYNNILFIYGKSGLGKTHLLNAIGNYINFLYFFKVKVIYIKSEVLILNILKFINNYSILEFQNSFRSATILLIDDIHFFFGKKIIQLNLLNIINFFLESGKFLVVTSNKNIKNLNFNLNLSSILYSGLNIKINRIDFFLKKKFIYKKIKFMNLNFKDNIICFISKMNIKNIYELNSFLNILNYNILNKKYFNNITISFLEKIFCNFFLKNNFINVFYIIEIVSNYFSITVNKLLSKSRCKFIVYPRQIAIAISRKLTNYSLIELGFFFKNINHSTILYSCKKINNLCLNNNLVKNDFLNLISIILNKKKCILE